MTNNNIMKDSVSTLTMNQVSSNYSVLALIALSILGILAHLFFDFVKIKQSNPETKLKDHLSKSYPSMILSLIICIVFVMIRHEFMNIPDFTNWEGASMALVGYFGGSILIPLLSITSSKFGIKDSVKPVLILFCLFLSSCASLNIGVKNHTKTNKEEKTALKENIKVDSNFNNDSSFFKTWQKIGNISDNSTIIEQDSDIDTTVNIYGFENRFRVNLISSPVYLSGNKGKKPKIFDLKSNNLTLHCIFYKDDGVLSIDAVVNDFKRNIVIHKRIIENKVNKTISNKTISNENQHSEIATKVKSETQKEEIKQVEKKSDITTIVSASVKIGANGWYLAAACSVIFLIIGIRIGKSIKK